MKSVILPTKTVQHLLFDGRWLFQLVRYGFVGVSSNVVFYVIANLTFLYTTSAMASSVVGWSFSYLVSLLGHGFFTYRSIIYRSVIGRFTVLACSNLLIIQVLTYFGEQVFMWPYWMSTLIIVLIVPVFSFLAGRHLVFSPNSRKRKLPGNDTDANRV